MSILKSVDRRVDYVATCTQSVSWALLRIVSSVMLLTHGWPKMFGPQSQPFLGGMDFFGLNLGVNMLWIAGVIELFGGILLVLGLFTRYAAFMVALLMVMAYLAAHPAWFPTLNGGELAALYFVVYLAIFAYGPGKFSLDYAIFRRH